MFTKKINNSLHDAESLKQEIAKIKQELEAKETAFKKANEEVNTLHQEFEKKNEELKKLDQLKNDFISTVSHELRTPLSITKEGISLVLDRIPGDLNHKQNQILTTAKDNIDRLARLINDLLDISKIESGKIELKKALVNLTSLIKHVVYSFEMKVRNKGLELRAKFPQEGIEVYADADKIIQVLTNLVGNALKFTGQGYIEIEARAKENEIECIVADSGMGIAEEDMPRVFDKFQQFSRTAGAGEKGTGLGLAISKKLVEMHHGRIWVETKLGEGTQFIFTIPKYTASEVFREYIHNGMREVMKSGARLSLIVVSITEFQKVKQKFSAHKLEMILRILESLIKNSLRRAGDVTFRDTGEAVILLINCDKENASKILEERIKPVLNEYLMKENLSGIIELNFGYATYPDEANSDQELIDKARKKEG